MVESVRKPKAPTMDVAGLAEPPLPDAILAVLPELIEGPPLPGGKKAHFPLTLAMS
jgi:hypothetical protein